MIPARDEQTDRLLKNRESEAQPLGSLLLRVLENRGLVPAAWQTVETNERRTVVLRPPALTAGWSRNAASDTAALSARKG